MNESQRIDHAYHEDKLLLLISQRGRLRADSDQVNKLNIEILAVTDLVRSYRIVKALARKTRAKKTVANGNGRSSPG